MYKFKPSPLITQALTHRSYLHQEKNLNTLDSNERLEFLGDAVLDLWATQVLYNLFPNFDEGKLSNLHSLTIGKNNLSVVAKKLGLDQQILLSSAEERNGGRTNPSILEDAFEAVVGAIYLDSGMDSVNKFLEENLLPTLIDFSKQVHYKDPKSYFQELVQAKEGITPHYEIISQSGPDHQKTFKLGAFVGDRLIATGSGKSKQQAETDASTKATQIYESKV